MSKVQKVLISGLSVAGVISYLLIVRSKKHYAGVYQSVGKVLDKKMKKLMWVIDKATVHVQSAIKAIKK